MTLLSVDALKEHLGQTSLGDDALARLLDAAEADITARAGPVDGTTEFLRATGPLLGLSRDAESITAVTENGVALGIDDYTLRPSGSLLVRLLTGSHPARHWRGLVEVAYIPRTSAAERIRVQIGLVKLEMTYSPGVSSETLGTWTESSSQQQGVTYAQLREEYLASLEPVVGILR